MKILQEFKEFAIKGNVVDMAVGVIIGGAFGKIITSLVEDIITPVLLNPALQAANVQDLQNLSVNGIKYGLFLAAILNFLVIAFCLFLIIRAFEKAQRRFFRSPEATEAAPPDPAIIAQERLTGALERLTTTIETRN